MRSITIAAPLLAGCSLYLGGATDHASGNTSGSSGGALHQVSEQGIAWRPGEIWVASWYMPMEVFDESGRELGTIDLPELRAEGASPMHHLAFDRGQLLVGYQGQLTWYDVRP